MVASSEAAPFSKSGGLADVTPALCKSLANSGHDVTLVVPYHRQTREVVEQTCGPIHDSGLTFDVPNGRRKLQAGVYWANLENSDVHVLLIDHPYFFDRPGLYQEHGRDYDDNCERFCFFSRAVVECCRKLVLRPNVIHANDWQTALIPALIDIERRGQPEFAQTATVLTIHNLAFQGAFGHDSMPLTGLDWQYYNWEQMEANGGLNLLKTGIVFADKITTVSPTYAEEIQHAEAGCGLQHVIRHRRQDLTGILNGIDTETWNPAIDPHIAEVFDVAAPQPGKAACKRSLQQRMGLLEKPNTPLFSVISRMTDQKGFDLIAAKASDILQHDVQLVVLGTGEARYETMFRELQQRYPNKVAAHIGFDESLAHQIEAGSDVFLMPSRFEPCGLNQMYSLAYGTIPLIRKVGGLADSVVDASPTALSNDTATGIVFDDYDAEKFFHAFERALWLYNDEAKREQVIRRGMSRDSSWTRSASEYLSVYEDAVARRVSAPQPVQ